MLNRNSAQGTKGSFAALIAKSPSSWLLVLPLVATASLGYEWTPPTPLAMRNCHKALAGLDTLLMVKTTAETTITTRVAQDVISSCGLLADEQQAKASKVAPAANQCRRALTIFETETLPQVDLNQTRQKVAAQHVSVACGVLVEDAR